LTIGVRAPARKNALPLKVPPSCVQDDLPAEALGGAPRRQCEQVDPLEGGLTLVTGRRGPGEPKKWTMSQCEQTPLDGLGQKNAKKMQ
jgi:hypothetical protein